MHNHILAARITPQTIL